MPDPSTASLLVHVCCAPCSIACVEALREEGHDLTGFWYNPNIHPYTEYLARKNALEGYAGSIGLALVMRDEYGLRPFVRAVAEDIDGRCSHCYDVRMRAVASHAAAHGFSGFTSTLLISPYQDHARLIGAAEAAAASSGVPFVYRDFRPLFREGQQKARSLDLYRQKYCGCLFSEEDRYCVVKKK